MAVYHISYYLYRSNPVIQREIKIPIECTVQDLCGSFCLAMGISVEQSKILDEDEREISKEKKLLEVFGTGSKLVQMAGRCMIYHNKQMQEIMSLTFFYEVLKETDETILAPDIVEGAGFHLPQDIFRIGLINEIQEGLRTSDSYSVNGVGTFYQAQQVFQQKKTRNLLHSWFLPEMVSTLKTEFAVPLTAVLENKTMAVLRELADRHHVYTYGSKKADYVVALNSKLCENDPQRIFTQMSALEYQYFRELLLKGTIPCATDEELQKLFPVLYSYGVMSFSKKQGVLLWSAIVQDYEEWFDQEEERQFRIGKRIAFVMTGCRIYYGIFDKNICYEVLEALYPGEVSREIFEQFWEDPFRSSGLNGIQFSVESVAGVRIAYDKVLFKEKELLLYLRALAGDESARFLPDKEMFELVSHNGIHSVLNEYGELFLFMRTYAYGDEERRELCDLGINFLRKGYSAGEASRRVVSFFHYFWGNKEKVGRELEDILGRMSVEVPNILYYGYTLKEAKEKRIHSRARVELNRLIKEMQEEEKRAKEAAEARKKAAAAQKKAKTTGTGKRGKRG